MYSEARPAPVTTIVPFEVKGLFETVNADGIVKPTDVNPASVQDAMTVPLSC